MKHTLNIEWDDDCPVCNGHFWRELASGECELCARCNATLFGDTIKQIGAIVQSTKSEK